MSCCCIIPAPADAEIPMSISSSADAPDGWPLPCPVVSVIRIFLFDKLQIFFATRAGCCDVAAVPFPHPYRGKSRCIDVDLL